MRQYEDVMRSLRDSKQQSLCLYQESQKAARKQYQEVRSETKERYDELNKNMAHILRQNEGLRGQLARLQQEQQLLKMNMTTAAADRARDIVTNNSVFTENAACQAIQEKRRGVREAAKTAVSCFFCLVHNGFIVVLST